MTLICNHVPIGNCHLAPFFATHFGLQVWSCKDVIGQILQVRFNMPCDMLRFNGSGLVLEKDGPF
jgi:hypothetical protein